MRLQHGGELLAVASRYATPVDVWLDLSTGVNPQTYPLPAIPDSQWNRLPQCDQQLEQAAADYYGCPQLPLAVAGSQAAIMALPKLLMQELAAGRVLLPAVGYKEHQQAWQRYPQHWQTSFYSDLPTSKQLDGVKVLVLINPNNPSGLRLAKAQVLQLCDALAANRGIVVVDEAFMDLTPEESVVDQSARDNLIVLRSVGKFFGLAGARVGFVFSHAQRLKRLADLLGPWAVNGPARYVVTHALHDRAWQQKMRCQLQQDAQRLSRLLHQQLAAKVASGGLFVRVELADAAACHDFLCRQQILTRLCDEQDALRFGLPHGTAAWLKLRTALSELAKQRAAV